MVMFLVWGWPAVFRRYLPHFLLAAGLFAFGTRLRLPGGFRGLYDKASLGPQRSASAADRT